MNKNNECSYGNIMRFCKHITKREMRRGKTFAYVQEMLLKAVEVGCAKGLARFWTELDLETYDKGDYNAKKRENNRNEEHTYKKD